MRLKLAKAKSKPISYDQALRLAWERGLLSFILYPYQNRLYNDLWGAINNPECVKYVLNVSRRWGKSTVLCLIAIEFAIRNPNSQIRFAAPTAKALRKIIKPLFKMILQTCPSDLKPRYYTQDNIWIFPNGSEIHLAGTDNGHYESLRGTASNLNLIDEAGFCDDLDYVVRSVLLPQTLTTGGKTLLASTPPTTPAHDFTAIAQECEAQGLYNHYTIYDNESLSKEVIELYTKESGGVDSTTFKREYLAQFVVDKDSQIIPEWSDDYITEHIPDEYTRYWHRYTAMDLGVRDFTAVLYGHYNFLSATLYVEDESTLNGPDMTTNLLRDEIIAKETQYFPSKVYRRISDNNNLMLLQDLGTLHNMPFIPVVKTTLDAMVNELRMLVGQGRIRIHPRCTKLIGCLKYGIWNEKRDKFARSTVYKHFDHLAALIYLVRHVDKLSNPIPTTHAVSINTHFIPQTQSNNKDHNTIRRLFGKSFT